jgi:hypothetical protein
MVEFASLNLFQKDAELSTPWKDIARQRLVHEAVAHTLARMAWDGATAEQLLGARKFVTHFLNCGEVQEAISVASVPRLNYNVEEQIAASRNKKD